MLHDGRSLIRFFVLPSMATTSRRFLVAGCLCAALSPGLALAQQADRPLGYSIPYAQGVSPSTVAKGTAFGQDLAASVLGRYDQLKSDPGVAAYTTQARLVDQIANKQIERDKDQTLAGLGLNPLSNNALFYFVSWSMPLNMLRSYALEAMWDGGTLVFRGIPPGMTWAQFALHDLKSLVYGKGASANISIDPRLFDAYKVTSAPTIVFTTTRQNLACDIDVPFVFRKRTLTYKACPPVAPAAYDKVIGGVTSVYALQTFIDGGRTQAKPYLAALARGYAGTGTQIGKDQTPFDGKWSGVQGPEQLQREFGGPGTGWQPAGGG